MAPTLAPRGAIFYPTFLTLLPVRVRVRVTVRVTVRDQKPESRDLNFEGFYFYFKLREKRDLSR